MSEATTTVTVTFPEGMPQVEKDRLLRRIEHQVRSVPRVPLGVKIRVGEQ